MFVKVLSEAGSKEALLGISLSHRRREVSDDDIDWDHFTDVAKRLADKDGGHNGFLEFLVVYLDIIAPRYWWVQFDRYRHVSKLSESTMHTLMKDPIQQSFFEKEIDPSILKHLEELRNSKDFEQLKNELPEGFLQRRIVTTNYKSLRNMILQRKGHLLGEWRIFISELGKQLKYASDFLPIENRKKELC